MCSTNRIGRWLIRTLITLSFFSLTSCVVHVNSQPKAEPAAASNSSPLAPKSTTNDVIWIDVRTAEEFAEDHFSPALNVPHDQIATTIETITTDKSAPIYLYCGSGRRAGKAKAALDALGYSRVINQGGLDDVRENFAETSSEQGASSNRQSEVKPTKGGSQ